MALRIAINGFGRIGRMICRLAARERGLRVAAVRDLADAPALAHLLAYDSVYGRSEFPVSADACWSGSDWRLWALVPGPLEPTSPATTMDGST